MYTRTTHTPSQATEVAVYTQPSHSHSHSHSPSQVASWLALAYRVATHPAVYTDEVALASAEARIARLEAGVVLAVDVDGLMDWAEAMGW